MATQSTRVATVAFVLTQEGHTLRRGFGFRPEGNFIGMYEEAERQGLVNYTGDGCYVNTFLGWLETNPLLKVQLMLPS